MACCGVLWRAEMLRAIRAVCLDTLQPLSTASSASAKPGLVWFIAVQRLPSDALLQMALIAPHSSVSEALNWRTATTTTTTSLPLAVTERWVGMEEVFCHTLITATGTWQCVCLANYLCVFCFLLFFHFRCFECAANACGVCAQRALHHCKPCHSSKRCAVRCAVRC